MNGLVVFQTAQTCWTEAHYAGASVETFTIFPGLGPWRWMLHSDFHRINPILGLRLENSPSPTSERGLQDCKFTPASEYCGQKGRYLKQLESKQQFWRDSVRNLNFAEYGWTVWKGWGLNRFSWGDLEGFQDLTRGEQPQLLHLGGPYGRVSWNGGSSRPLVLILNWGELI